VDAVYLGDLVGYAAHPNEVTERIQTEGIPTIMATDLPDKFAVDIETGGSTVNLA
jgi:hypothetical protein